MHSTNKNAIDYLIQGYHLIFQAGVKKFVIIPMIANIVIMSLLIAWFFSKLSVFIDMGMQYVPDWLQWLSYIISALLLIMLSIMFCYFFSAITNIIAAPFNGLLAEHVEAHLTGEPAPETTAMDLIRDVPRIMKREFQKIVYYLAWAVPLFILYWVPVIGQTVVPVVWFVFTAWMINVQYADYAFDNHKVGFKEMKIALRRDAVGNCFFGAVISLFTMFPILNLIIMPIAVCGATAKWVDVYRKEFRRAPMNQR